ncbi:hypothetical protein D7V86_21920 [bacterium D16-51]|nr:hypothetical protein D7V96_03755 [bacterium D16-59]RKI55343.1 hypothetical protein D7V86_21920 [bacterium D16-51]
MREHKFRKILAVWLAAALLLVCTDTASAQSGRGTGSRQYRAGDYFEDIPDNNDGSFWDDDSQDDFWDDGYEDITDDIEDDFWDDDYEDAADDTQDDIWDDDYEDAADDTQDDFWDDDYEDIIDDTQDDIWDDDYENIADDTQDDVWDDDYGDIEDDTQDGVWDDDYEDAADDTQDDFLGDEKDTAGDGNNDSIGTKRPAKKGSVLTVPSKNCKVKVVSAAIGNPAVSYYRTVKKNGSAITVPEKVTVDKVTYKVVAVADNAFSGNKKVNRVVVGRNVAKIGKKAFFNCKNLKQITFRTVSISSVGKDALKNTGKNLVIKAPKAKLAKYKKLFSGKGNKKINMKRSNN